MTGSERQNRAKDGVVQFGIRNPNVNDFNVPTDGTYIDVASLLQTFQPK